MFASPHRGLTKDRARYVGDPLAIVIAETQAEAEDAAEKVQVDYVDPYIPVLALKEEELTAVPLDEERVRNADCVVILTDHSIFDYTSIIRAASLLVDTRNATAGVTEPHIIRL